MTRPEELISRVFGVPIATVNDATSNTSLPEWDSLGHITLLMELESTYGVALSPEESLQLTSVAAIKQMLAHRGVA